MNSLLNIGSVVLAFASFMLPIRAIHNYRESNKPTWMLNSFLSILACSLAIFAQFLTYKSLIEIKDWTAILDTIGFVCWASGILLIITVILNGIAFFLCIQNYK